MNVEELRDQVRQLQWFHRINLGHGIVTPGVDKTEEKLLRMRLPESLAGKRVLDVGAWDGFFSFEAERRGAAEVLAVDAAWGPPDGEKCRRGFDLARRVLDSRVQHLVASVFELWPSNVGTFDVVMFLGVLYHVRHPLLALEQVARLTRDWLIIETEIDLRGRGRPALAFYPAAELNGDAGNWFAPNVPALRAMLRDVGFSHVQVVSQTSLGRTIARAGAHWWRHGTNPWLSLQRGRIVVHARKSQA